MKKFLTLALTAVMALSLLTACGSKNAVSYTHLRAHET